MGGVGFGLFLFLCFGFVVCVGVVVCRGRCCSFWVLWFYLSVFGIEGLWVLRGGGDFGVGY